MQQDNSTTQGTALPDPNVQGMDYNAGNTFNIPNPVTPPPPSLYEGLHPAMANLVDQVGNSTKSRNLDDTAWQSATQGLNVDEQDDINLAKYLTDQISQQLTTVDPTEVNNALKHVTDLVDQHFSQANNGGQVALQQPSLAQGALAGLGAILFPRQAGQIAATPFQTQLKQQESDQANSDQQFKYQVAGANSAVDNAVRMLGINEQSKAHNLNAIQTQLSAVMSRINKADINTRITGDQTTTRLLGAIKNGDAQSVVVMANRLKTLGTQYAIPPDQVQNMVQEAMSNKALSLHTFVKDTIHEYSQDGIVDDKDAAAINERFRAMEQASDLAPNTLGQAPTFTTVARQRLDEHMTEFSQVQQRLKDQFGQNMTLKQDEFKRLLGDDLAKRDMFQQRLNQSQNQWSADYNLRVLNEQNKTVNKKVYDILNSADPVHPGINPRIAQLEGELRGMPTKSPNKADQERVNKLTSELSGLNAQRQYYEQMQSPVIDIPNPMGSGNIGQIPNPNYQPAPGDGHDQYDPNHEGNVDPNAPQPKGAVGPAVAGVGKNLVGAVGGSGTPGGYPNTPAHSGMIWKKSPKGYWVQVHA